MMSPAKSTTRTIPSMEKESDDHSHLVLWTGLAAVVSAVLGLWWISPVICAAPLVHAVYRRGPRADLPTVRAMTIRWALVLMVTTMLVSAFVPGRVAGSVLFGKGAEITAQSWLAGQGGPMWGLGWLAIMPVLLGAVTALSAGILGVALLSIFVADAAVSAAVIYAHSTNLFSATVIALSPWQWAFLAGAVMAVPPLAGFSLANGYRRSGIPFDPVAARRELLWAGALFALALVLRVALSPLYTTLASRWTLS